VKQPERYEPTEEVEDDYSDHDDVPESDVSSEISYDEESDEEEEGSLKDFIDDDDEEEDESIHTDDE
jgi:hypothetical protein